jgi:hypothetical protein
LLRSLRCVFLVIDATRSCAFLAQAARASGLCGIAFFLPRKGFNRFCDAYRAASLAPVVERRGLVHTSSEDTGMREDRFSLATRAIVDGGAVQHRSDNAAPPARAGVQRLDARPTLVTASTLTTTTVRGGLMSVDASGALTMWRRGLRVA